MAFYLSIDGANRGPIELGTLENQFRSGQIPPSTPCWTDGWPAWRPVSEAFPEWGQPRVAFQPVESARGGSVSRPGTRHLKLVLVLLAGLISSCALGAAMALGAMLTGYSMYGWLIWGFVPVGAYAAGLCGAGGAYYAARWLHYYPRFAFCIGAIALGILTLIVTQYCSYSHFGTDLTRRGDLAGFERHLVWISHHVTLRPIHNMDADGVELGEASTWYYVAQLVGFSFGGVMVAAFVRSRPFCHGCQRYFEIKQLAEFHENTPELFSAKIQNVQTTLEHGNFVDAVRQHPIKRSLSDAGFKKGFRSSLTTFACSHCHEHRYRLTAYTYKRQGGWSEITEIGKDFSEPRRS